jgi:hypothetical protein
MAFSVSNLRDPMSPRMRAVAAEIDEARLVGMELKLVPCETLAQYV